MKNNGKQYIWLGHGRASFHFPWLFNDRVSCYKQNNTWQFHGNTKNSVCLIDVNSATSNVLIHFHSTPGTILLSDFRELFNQLSYIRFP